VRWTGKRLELALSIREMRKHKSHACVRPTAPSYERRPNRLPGRPNPTGVWAVLRTPRFDALSTTDTDFFYKASYRRWAYMHFARRLVRTSVHIRPVETRIKGPHKLSRIEEDQFPASNMTATTPLQT